MGYVCAFLGILGAAALLFLWWRYTSVDRGGRQRDERLLKILDPVGNKLSQGDQVTPDEISDLAAKPELRPMLYSILKHFERLDLFPAEHLELEAQAKAQLCYWMMHPNEEQDPPEEIELVETCHRGIDGRQATFFVFRFRMPEGHWVGTDWELGLAGPFFSPHVPYSSTGAFVRGGDKYGEIQPEKLVDWYTGMVEAKRS